MNVTLLIEGDGELTRGFNALFRAHIDELRKRDVTLKIALCGDKGRTKKLYDGLRQAYQKDLYLSLIDSDGPPPKVMNDDEFFMVQEMESWFLADPKLLENYFGRGFDAKAISGRPIEDIPDPVGVLQRAVKKTKKGPYLKVKHGVDLLALLEFNIVRQADNCDRLLKRLEKLNPPVAVATSR